MGRGEAGRMQGDIWLCCLALRLASSLEVSGTGRTGNTRLSRDEILLLFRPSRAIRLLGGSGRLVTDFEVEQRVGVEQVGRLM